MAFAGCRKVSLSEPLSPDLPPPIIPVLPYKYPIPPRVGFISSLPSKVPEERGVLAPCPLLSQCSLRSSASGWGSEGLGVTPDRRVAPRPLLPL